MKKGYCLLVVTLALACLATGCAAGTKQEAPVQKAATDASVARQQESEAQQIVLRYQAIGVPRGTDNANPVSYQIIAEMYIEHNDRRDIAIRYPQIVIAGDSDRQARINDLLKMEALRIVIPPRDNDRHFPSADQLPDHLAERATTERPVQRDGRCSR